MTWGKKTILSLSLAFLLLLGGFAIGLDRFVDHVQNPPKTALRPIDAIVVLTGGTNRLQTGFDLLQQGMGKKLFISGVYRGVEIQELLRLWHDKETTTLDCCIALGFNAENTVGNAEETAAWLTSEEFSSIYLVTANYHMPRAMAEFKHAAPSLAIIPYPVSPEKLDLAQWWKDQTTRRLILGEYIKYLAVSFIYLFV